MISVSLDNDSEPRKHRSKRRMDAVFDDGTNRISRFVKYKDVRLTCNSSCQAYSLALASGQAQASLTYVCAQAVGQLLNEIQNTGDAQGRSRLFDCRLRMSHADVVQNRAFHKIDILACDRHPLQPA